MSESSASLATEHPQGVRNERWTTRAGKFRPVILLFALGVPIPILLIVFLLRGCST